MKSKEWTKEFRHDDLIIVVSKKYRNQVSNTTDGLISESDPYIKVEVYELISDLLVQDLTEEP